MAKNFQKQYIIPHHPQELNPIQLTPRRDSLINDEWTSERADTNSFNVYKSDANEKTFGSE